MDGVAAGRYIVAAMQRLICRVKITGAVVSQSLIRYDGSCGIDSAILEVAGIVPNEWIVVANVTTGARFETYAIPEPARSGTINIYGAAAHHAAAGHELIVMSLGWLEEGELQRFAGTRVVKLKPGNRL